MTESQSLGSIVVMAALFGRKSKYDMLISDNFLLLDNAFEFKNKVGKYYIQFNDIEKVVIIKNGDRTSIIKLYAKDVNNLPAIFRPDYGEEELYMSNRAKTMLRRFSKEINLVDAENVVG